MELLNVCGFQSIVVADEITKAQTPGAETARTRLIPFGPQKTVSPVKYGDARYSDTVLAT
jgi:hypothetical protein